MKEKLTNENPLFEKYNHVFPNVIMYLFIFKDFLWHRHLYLKVERQEIMGERGG